MATVKILKFYPEKCDGSDECMKACSNVHFKNDDGGQWSAINIVKNADGYNMEVCNHCGLCIDMCPVQALRRLPNGNVILNTKICVGCQACVAFCPRGVMRKAEDRMEPFKCISCGACVRACPEDALSLVEMDIADLEEEVYAQQGVCE